MSTYSKFNQLKENKKKLAVNQGKEYPPEFKIQNQFRPKSLQVHHQNHNNKVKEWEVITKIVKAQGENTEGQKGMQRQSKNLKSGSSRQLFLKP